MSYFVFKSDLEVSNSMKAAMARYVYHQKFNGYFDIYGVSKCNAEEQFVPLQTKNRREMFGIILVKGWRVNEARTEWERKRKREKERRGKIDTLWNALMESIELTLNKEKNLVNFWCGTKAVVISFSAAYQFNATLANCVNRLNIVIIYLILVSTRLHSPTFYICHCILISPT